MIYKGPALDYERKYETDTRKRPVYGIAAAVLIIAIDPGITGALALLDRNGLVAVADMPTTLKGKGAGRVKNEVNAAGLNAMLQTWTEGHADEVLAVMEQVSSMPGQGAASTFSLGDSRGCIRGVIAARGYPLEWITPHAWKRHYGLTADKEQARAKAIQLYPEADLARKRDHNRAEAILIARYGYERFARIATHGDARADAAEGGGISLNERS